LVTRTESLTYRDLAARADRVADVLRQRGLRPGRLAVLHVDRSAALLTGLLGILRTGGAWVPVDPALPAARVQQMLADADPCLIVTQAHLEEGLPPGGAPRVLLDRA